MSMNKYESTFICKPQLSNEELNELVEKIRTFITRQKGVILGIDNWGKKKFAYTIKRCKEGHYVFMQLSLPSETVKELHNYYQVNENIIRYLTVRAPVIKPVIQENAAKVEIKNTVDTEVKEVKE